MELKGGYRNTDVGIIPEDWEVKSIKGITTDMLQGVNTAIDIPEYVESGFPILKANNIIDGEVNFDTSDHISVKTYQGYSDRFKIKKDDFLFSNIGARLGTGSLMKTNIECSFAWNVMRIIPNQKIVKPEFLGCIMNSPALFKEIKKNESGSGMGFVPKNVLQTLIFPIPKKLEEQTAIATALSDADALISRLEKLIAKKRNIKQGAMQKLLQPKEGWEVKKLGEVLKVKHGKDQKAVQTENGIYPILGTGGLMGYTNDFLYDKPSVLIGRKGTIDKPQFMKTPFWTVDTLFYCEIFKGYDAKFIFYIFNLIDWYSYNEASGVPSLNAKTIEKIEKGFPSLDKQTQIAIILSDMDSEIYAYENKLEKYRKLKMGMMQNLLTGRIRLV